MCSVAACQEPGKCLEGFFGGGFERGEGVKDKNEIIARQICQ